MRQDVQHLTQISTRIPRELHHAIRVHCVHAGESMQEFIERALRLLLQRQKP